MFARISHILECNRETLPSDSYTQTLINRMKEASHKKNGLQFLKKFLPLFPSPLQEINFILMAIMPLWSNKDIKLAQSLLLPLECAQITSITYSFHSKFPVLTLSICKLAPHFYKRRLGCAGHLPYDNDNDDFMLLQSTSAVCSYNIQEFIETLHQM